MVPAADGYVFFIENHGGVTDGDAVECNTDESAAFLRVSENFHLRDLRKLFQRVVRNFFFVLANVLDANRINPFDGFAETDDFGNHGRTCFKAGGNIGVSRLFEGHVLDHLAAAVPGGHTVENIVLAVEYAYACRAVHFVTAEGEKIAVELLHVNLDVAGTLGGINQNFGLRGELADGRDNFCNGVHGTDGIAHVGDSHHLGACVQKFGELAQVQIAVVQNRDDLDLGALHFGDNLPAHDVGVMLESANQNFVACFEELATVTPRHQIDAFGGAAGEYDFVFGFGVDELGHVLAGGFECFGGAGAQAVYAALYGTVVLAVKVVHDVDHAVGLLRGGRAVQEGERLCVLIACDEHREFVADFFSINHAPKYRKCKKEFSVPGYMFVLWLAINR